LGDPTQPDGYTLAAIGSTNAIIKKLFIHHQLQ
jgi:hypothetical protein